MLQEQRLWVPLIQSVRTKGCSLPLTASTLREKQLRLKKRPAIKAADEVADIKKEEEVDGTSD